MKGIVRRMGDDARGEIGLGKRFRFANWRMEVDSGKSDDTHVGMVAAFIAAPLLLLVCAFGLTGTPYFLLGRLLLIAFIFGILGAVVFIRAFLKELKRGTRRFRLVGTINGEAESIFVELSPSNARQFAQWLETK